MRSLSFALAACLMLFPWWTAPAVGQILNTLDVFGEPEPGWHGGVRAAASISGGNTEVLSLRGGARLQWQGDRNRWRLLASATRKTSRGEEIAEDSVVHLRHNRRLQPWVSTLAFVQRQNNPFQRLRSRFLVGAGARFDVLRADQASGSVGIAHMVEVERIEGTPGHDTDQRLSSFFVLGASLNERVRVSATAFVQPLWEDVADLRALASAGLRADLGGGLGLNVEADYRYDARPPQGVDRSDRTLETGFSYNF